MPRATPQGLVELLLIASTSGVHHGIAKGRVAVAGRRALVGDVELAVAGLPARLVLGKLVGSDALEPEGVEPLLAVLVVDHTRNELHVSGGAAGALDGSRDFDVWNANEALGGERDSTGHVEHEVKHTPLAGAAR